MSAPTLTRAPADDAPARRSREPAGPQPVAGALGAVTVLAGSAALSSILDGGEWVLPAVQIVGLVWLIGLGCRLLRVPAPVTVLAQAGGVVVTLTAVFTSGGYGGLIPNARAVREARALVDGAWDQIMQSTVPAPATPELAFLVAVSLGLIALIVDFLVCEVEAPALVALPLLCLYSVPASINEALLPWQAFALPAAGYAALVAVAGHPGRRVGLRAGVGVAVAGGVALVLAVGASVLVADAITEVGTAGRLDRSGQGGGGNIGLSAFASLHGDLVRGDSQDVVRVTGLPQPDYLRTTALEGWNAEQGFGLVDPQDGARDAGSPIDVTPLARNPAAQPATVDVQVLNFSDRFVPMYQGTYLITGLTDGYSYNPELGSVFQDAATRPQDYRLSISAGAVSQEALRQDTVTPTDTLTATDGVSSTAVALAQQVTADAATPFDRALALTEYFTDDANGFVYDLQVPVGNSGDLLTDFLTNKRGYCEQYAAAMAIMLRTLDIPARVAIGFTQGEPDPAGGFVVDSHDAHAWVEVRFDGAGWVRFDPTPLDQDVAGQQGFATSTAPTTESTSAPSLSVPTGGGRRHPGGRTRTDPHRLHDGDGGRQRQWERTVLASLDGLDPRRHGGDHGAARPTGAAPAPPPRPAPGRGGRRGCGRARGRMVGGGGSRGGPRRAAGRHRDDPQGREPAGQGRQAHRGRASRSAAHRPERRGGLVLRGWPAGCGSRRGGHRDRHRSRRRRPSDRGRPRALVATHVGRPVAAPIGGRRTPRG